MYHFPSMNRANDRLSTDDLIGFAPFKKNLDPISSGWKLPITREEIVGGSFIRERESQRYLGWQYECDSSELKDQINE